ncbi:MULTISPECIES: DNA internalization-related competence protein ComEC/Rec2 [unclassified Pseudoalteromonas]|uniref:DNA internalization-related competence protein ComEC/Rec2 n=1 Tax=unclassified Pseudoalteromonas TaxID=194690 RepID=UPI000C08C29F|nr:MULTISPECIES: DNA internalization-related competence protein ComEC/Rec2 [unclassified Pseudoalteromonas]MDP2634588.1 DNA internalization-related competence protein ComEC/Rec2 [Pseudoalteromonas sp. 1_MG-2023]PHN91128.1 DNA internalization-related competence protein ComEC/Rec2 [Pseudoalteromonas sp. 3D05]
MDRFFSHLKQPFTSVWLSIGFVIGCVITVFYYQTLVFTLFTLLIVIASAYFKPFLPVMLGFICGILAVWLHFLCFYSISSQKLSVNQPELVTFVVQEIISQRDSTYLKAAITYPKNLTRIKSPKVLVTLKTEYPIKVGSTVTTWLKLTKYRSQKNVAGFDKERAAFSHRILFKAKQVSTAIQISNAVAPNLINKYRRNIQNIYDGTHMSWLYYALMTGDKSVMSYDHKQTLQAFGISHLLAISGLHIGLVFSIGYFAFKYALWFFIRTIKQTVNLSIYYSAAGFCLAFCYVYLSDFLVSASRALIMLACILIVYYSSKQALRWRALLFALVLILAIDPFSLLNPGLYLSFVAVGVIFVLVDRRPFGKFTFFTFFKGLVVLQCALFVGLLPLTLFFFHGVSLIGLLVNLIAVPLISFIVMPTLLFISLLSPTIDMTLILSLLDSLIRFCFEGLLLIPVEVRWINAPSIALPVILATYLSAIVFYMLPYGKVISLLPLSIIIIDYYLTPKAIWQVNVFDVGHGTMILVTKDNEGFVYDLGPIYFNRFTRIYSTLKPYLEINQIEVIHTVISHDDKDHSGGLDEWLKLGYERTFKTTQPEGVDSSCFTQTLNFNNLHITMSHKVGKHYSDNDNSCIVHISDGINSVLLPGDITQLREQELITEKTLLKSTVLVSPHHGSKTSSSNMFIKAVSPEVVIHSTAFKGQWNLPHEEVLKRYDAINAQQYTTAEHGQIIVKFYKSGYEISSARAQSDWFLKD